MRTVLVLALLGLGLAVHVARLRGVRPEPQPDDMAQPFLDSRNSATYLYNARTGVLVSYN